MFCQNVEVKILKLNRRNQNASALLESVHAVSDVIQGYHLRDGNPIKSKQSWKVEWRHHYEYL